MFGDGGGGVEEGSGNEANILGTEVVSRGREWLFPSVALVIVEVPGSPSELEDAIALLEHSDWISDSRCLLWLKAIGDCQ